MTPGDIINNYVETILTRGLRKYMALGGGEDLNSFKVISKYVIIKGVGQPL